MFRMTADILIGSFKPVKPNSITWSRSIAQFSDTATIKIPAMCRLKVNGETYDKVQTGLQFTEGMKAEVYAGYDGNNTLRFKGFIRRINFTVPLEIECEGYSYQLRKKLNITKSYKNTTVRNILNDLVAGTDIKLSDSIPNIPIETAIFNNASGVQVLEWLKEKALLTVYFNFDTLYVGGMALEPKKTTRFRLNWNVIKDNELKFEANKEFAEVRIQLGSKRDKEGQRKKAYSGNLNGQVKKLYTAIQDEKTQSAIAEQKRKEIVNQGYEGAITAFLVPVFNPGESVSIEDAKYPERTGKYFGVGVEGSFSLSGGRQKIKIGYTLG